MKMLRKDATQENFREVVGKKCSRCGGSVHKYSPTGNFYNGFFYECVDCGLPMRDCVCAVEKETTPK